MSFRINRGCEVCGTHFSYESDNRPENEKRCAKCQHVKVPAKRTRRR